MRIPRKLSGPGKFIAEFNRMVDALNALQPRQSKNVRTSITPRGTFREAQPSEDSGGKGKDFVWL